MYIELNVTTREDGHRKIIFDASTEPGGEGLECEIATLIAGGHTVFVTLEGKKEMLPVVAYDHHNRAWITRGEQTRTVLTAPKTSVTALKPVVGG